ncbi:MAG: hypothetical protein ABIW33_01640 [Sphingomicrobium sp.]
MTSKTLTLLALAGSALLAFAPAQAAPTRNHGDAALERTVVALANEFARNATALHPERNAHLIPDTQKVVYVSNGVPIRGHQYVKQLTSAYAARRSASLHWDKWEVTPVGKDAAVFTGWSTMSEETHHGVKKRGHYIFTAVFAKTAAGWKRVIAQKSPLVE